MIREAASIFEQVHGPIHPSTARLQVQYALLKANDGKIEEALHFQRKAVIAFERSMGVDNPLTLSNYRNLAQYEFALGNTEAALNLSFYTFSMYESLYGDGIHPDRPVLFTHIGTMLQKAKSFEKAIEFLEKAVQDSEYLYGKHHITYMNACENLVHGYFLVEEFKKAMVLQKRICSFYEAKLGPEDKTTVDANSIMASLTAKAVEKAKKAKMTKKK